MADATIGIPHNFRLILRKIKAMNMIGDMCFRWSVRICLHALNNLSTMFDVATQNEQSIYRSCSSLKRRRFRFCNISKYEVEFFVRLQTRGRTSFTMCHVQMIFPKNFVETRFKVGVAHDIGACGQIRFRMYRFAISYLDDHLVTLSLIAQRSVKAQSLAAFFNCRSCTISSWMEPNIAAYCGLTSNHKLTARLNLWLARPINGLVSASIYFLSVLLDIGIFLSISLVTSSSTSEIGWLRDLYTPLSPADWWNHMHPISISK